jgi:hypothetical protein
MKLGVARFGMVIAIVGLAALIVSTTAWAQTPASCPSATTSTISYTPDFTSAPGSLTLNSYTSTSLTGSSPTVLQLTSSTGNQTGSAWFNSAQNVELGFSTCFQFQFTNASTPPADGIAFVIQNSALGAIGYTGGNGGALGYGDDDASTNPSTGAGIPNSLAIEFDTFQNSWDPAPVNGSVSHVAVQSCGVERNTSHHGQLCGGSTGSNSTLGSPVIVPNMADGNVHTAIISYFPACPATVCTPSGTPANIHVILDGVDLYPQGVQVDLSSIGLGAGNTAYVGFTGATGSYFETQDILNWTYTPQAQTVVLSSTPTYLSFTNSNNTVVYNFGLSLTGGADGPTVSVQPTPMTQAACDALIDKNFFPARCFVYQNAEGTGENASVMFALTCPLVTGEQCSNIFAELTSSYTISKTGNPLFIYPGILGPLNPFPGLLKGSGPNPQSPCTAPVFLSNQIDTFFNDNGFTSGKSGGGLSCWVATYDTPGEIWPGITISSPSFTATYPPSTTETATYTCSNPLTSHPAGSATGPYLTVASCQQSTGTQTSCTSSPVIGPGQPGGQMCTGTFVTPRNKGLYIFAVTAIDSGGNQNVNAVLYNVK